FIIRRILWTLLVMFVITVLVFLIFFETPGVDPARQIAGRNPSASALKDVRHQFGLDEPIPIRYGELMKKLFVSRDVVSHLNQGVEGGVFRSEKFERESEDKARGGGAEGVAERQVLTRYTLRT